MKSEFSNRMSKQTKHQNSNSHIYIVASFNHTWIGNLIQIRAKLKFWNRYAGDKYSHISLSLDSSLSTMSSFARKKLHNPLVAGLVSENIREGVFAFTPEKSTIAVMRMDITRAQYDKMVELLSENWRRQSQLKYNFIGLICMLLCGRGIPLENHFICSQWVDSILKKCGIDLFQGKKASHNVRPFDIYNALKDKIIYEGPLTEYPEYSCKNNKSTYCSTNIKEEKKNAWT